MSDILLQKPAAGQNTTLAPQAEDRLVFEFDSSEATLLRDGDDLIMNFEDGASVSLTDFYVAYSSENMPTFLIEGVEIDGESFFAALGEELMPAAGDTASTPQGSGSSVDTLAGNLLSGIDRLGGLDQAYPEENNEEEDQAGGFTAGDDAGGNLAGGDDNDFVGNAVPVARPNFEQIREGAVAAGNLLANDSAGDTDGGHSGKEIISVTPPHGWSVLDKESLLEAGLSPEEADSILEKLDQIEDIEAYEDRFFDPESGDIFVLDKDTGEYGYVSASNSITESKQVEFDYSIKDADGDISDSSLTVTVTDVTLEIGTGKVLLEEEFIANGTKAHEDDVASAADGVHIKTGTVSISDAASIDSVAWNVITDAEGALVAPVDKDGNAITLKTSDDNLDIVWSYGTDAQGKEDTSILMGKDSFGNDVIKLEMDTNGEYTVTLSQAVEHATPDGGESADHNTDLAHKADDASDGADSSTDLGFSFTVKDAQGNSAEGSVIVQIEDDVIEIGNAENETVHLDGAGGTSADTGTDFYESTANADDLMAALGVDASTPADKVWGDASKPTSYNGKFYYNNEGKSEITVGDATTGFTITGAVVTKDPHGNGSIIDTSVTPTLGWREDNTDKNNDGKDYANGLGMVTPGKNMGDSYYEVGTGGEFATGAESEALIITLPEGSTACGVNISFGCFFNAGGDSADKNSEIVRLEFYLDGVLVHVVETVEGTLDGENQFNSSTITVPFDEVRIIPTQEGSDFVLSGVSFPEYDFVASGSGNIETEGADGLASVEFETIGVNGGSSVEMKEGSTLTLEDGTVLTLKEVNGSFVAYGENASGGTSDYFTLAMGSDGKWTIYQHEHFGDTINVSVKVTDHDGDTDTHTINMVGDDAPTAHDDVDSVTEGQSISGNVIAGTQTDKGTGNVADEAGDGTTILSHVTPVDTEHTKWIAVNPDTEGNSLTWESDLGTITFDANGNYTFTSTDGSVAENTAFDVNYTLEDADGDTASATLTVTVTATNTAPETRAAGVTLYGDDEDDILYGGAGDDTLYGEEGDDTLYGGAGDDILYGGEGDDLLFAGFNDTVYGGSGSDMIIFEDNLAELSGLDAANIFMDAGNDATEMDMLLTGATDLDTVKGLLESGNIMGMEVIVDTQDVDVAHKVLEDIGENNLTHWDATDITVTSKDGTYRQFTSGEDDNKLTILVNMTEFIG